MPSTGNPRVDAAVVDIAAAFAEWIRSVEEIRAEIRAEITAAGGDPDGPRPPSGSARWSPPPATSCPHAPATPTTG